MEWRELTVTNLRRNLFYFILIAYSALTVVPFLWSLSTSAKPQEEVFQSNILPHHVTVKAYVTVFKHIQPSFPLPLCEFFFYRIRGRSSTSGFCLAGWVRLRKASIPR